MPSFGNKSAMATGDVKLIGIWPCPYVNRAQLALKLKSIDYEFVEDNPHSRSQILVENNPVHKKVPVLIHGGRPVCESLIIVEYVDDFWVDSGPYLLPPDAYDHALARFWAAYIDEKWYPLFKVLRETEEEELKATLTQKLSEGLILIEEAFVQCSKGKPYFGGDNIGYLDIVLGSTLGWIRVTEMAIGVQLLDKYKAPALARWADMFSSNEAVKDVMPESGKLLELYEKIQAFVKTSSK